MADLFISYAREDRPQADAMARALQANGFEVFWDNEIPPGRTWADFIEAKLKACKVMLVLWSSASVGSQWVREEARIGRDAGKLIPVLLDTSQPPFGFGEVQSVSLSDWRGEPDHPGWRRLVDAIRSFAGQPASGPTSRPQPAPQPEPFFRPPPHASQPQGAQNLGFQTQARSGAADQMSPMGYIQKCLKLYADGKGRAGRSEFWWFLLFSFIASVIAYVVDASMFGTTYDGALIAPLASLVVILALIAPGLAVTSRRLHDIGLTGWIAIASLIPVVAIVIGLIPSSRDANQYGPNPNPA